MNGLFDSQKLKMVVNVQGTFDDYRRYKESQKISRRTWLGMILWVGIFFGGLIMAFGVHQMFYTPPVPSTFLTDVFTTAGLLSQLSWGSWAKVMLFLLAPIIAISWLIHGVQARLLA